MGWWNKRFDALDILAKALDLTAPLVGTPSLGRVIREIRQTEADLDREVEEAFDGLQRSSRLVTELTIRLQERQARLVKLKEEYDRLTELSAITRPQAEAVAQSLESAMGKSAKKERVVGFLLNLLAGVVIFVFGVLVSPFVKAVLPWTAN